jgi:hypothetical protein
MLLGVFALALEQHVGFADGVGFGVDLLAVQAAVNLQARLFANVGQGFFGHGEHAAGAAGIVKQQVGAGLELFLNGQKHQIGHQAHGVAWRPVFTGFFVVFFVELAHQLFKHGAHGVVVDAGGGEVNVRIEELVDQRAQRVGLGQGGELVAELEVLQNVQHVGGEAVEVVLKVGQQLLVAAA